MFDIKTSILMKTVFAAKSSNNLEDARTFLNISGKYAYEIQHLNEIAYLQSEVNDYYGSIETLKKCKKCLTLPEQEDAIRSNLAKMYNKVNDPENAIIQNTIVLNKNNNDIDAFLELSFSYYLKGDYKTSESMMRDLFKNPDLPSHVKGRIEYNIGSYDVENGDFQLGLNKFIDVGHKVNIWTHSELPGVPVWDGTIIPNKKIIIHGEGGIGDEIINVRFMKNIINMGMEAVWITNHKDLMKPFNRNGFTCVLNANDISDKDSCLQIMAMYLPIVLKIEKNELWNGKYLNPCDKYIEKWKKILPEGKKLGLKWSGNQQYEQNLHRSLPIEFVNDIVWDGVKVNLQMDVNVDGMFNVGSMIENIEDTLAILSLCDMTISSCTSIAHMVGSIGVSGIVCPPIACYYVWLGDAKWYSEKLHVVRQIKHNNWNDVFNICQEIINKVE